MSRSYRHTPVSSHGGRSEKQDKRIYNRRLRSGVRQDIHSCADFDSLILPIVRERSNPWDMNKDGKSYDSSLAAFARRLRKVTRVRGGRCRYFFVLTQEASDLVAARHAEIAVRFRIDVDSWWHRYFDRHDACVEARSLRK